MKFREIAEMTGEPIDTVKSKHRRALIALRRVLGAPELAADGEQEEGFRPAAAT
jgi:DNA-directed RNA polymerase specialized sigma24 family protein